MNVRKILCAWDALIFHAACSFRAELSRYYLHFVWWLLDPILTLATLYVVFGIFLASPQPNFTLFLLTGIVVWQWFANTVTNATNSIFGSMRMFQQFKVYPVHFPLCVFLQDLTKYVPVLMVFFLCVAIFGPVPVSPVWLGIIPVMAVEGLCVLGFSIMVASLVPFLPDLAKAVPIVINMLFFASGIFYDIQTAILPKHQAIIYANPNAVCITAMRDILINGRQPDWVMLGTAAAIGLGALILGLIMVTKFRRVYPRLISQ
ncbi:hypothetical protein C4J81_19205 (plasmid) [Deltaproteobacteria bacterium Smac51]|nr:hypothetical protein C4J81_19205 [Deltaproteobacteria bacterium Smac51]